MIGNAQDTPPLTDGPKAAMTITDSNGQTIVDEVGPGVQVIITSELSRHDNMAGSIRWRIEGTSQVHVYPDKSTVVLTTDQTGGLVRIQQIVAKGGQSDDLVVLLKCGKGPIPPPDVTPVDPVNPPVPAPTGIRVLLVWESDASAKLTREQLNILNSTQLVALLNERCIKVNNRPEWRNWDKSSIEKTGLDNESPLWQQLWKDTKDKLTNPPQLVIIANNKFTYYPISTTDTEAGIIAHIKRVTEGK